ncbi:MAG: hypothetical protein SGILL_007237 [Bacillariaceae sp.]
MNSEPSSATDCTMDACASSSCSSASSAACVTATNVAIEANNIACDLLNIVRPDAAACAIEVFSLSLSLLRKISQSAVSPDEIDFVKLATEARWKIQGVVQAVSATPTKRASSKSASRVIKMSFVNGPFQVTKEFLNKNSATLLYNMGLACLVAGTTSALSKSVSLFDLAYRLGADSSSIHNALKGDSTIQRICMDSLNLTAQLHHTRFEFAQAEERLQKLRALISSLPPTENPEEQKTRYHFWILTDLLQRPCMAAAA